MAYHVIGCGRSIVMFTYSILTDPGTHEYSDSNSNEVKNYRTGSCPGLEFHHPKMEKGTPIKSRHGLEPHHPSMKNNLHSRGETHNNKGTSKHHQMNEKTATLRCTLLHHYLGFFN